MAQATFSRQFASRSIAVASLALVLVSCASGLKSYPNGSIPPNATVALLDVTPPQEYVVRKESFLAAMASGVVPAVGPLVIAPLIAPHATRVAQKHLGPLDQAEAGLKSVGQTIALNLEKHVEAQLAVHKQVARLPGWEPSTDEKGATVYVGAPTTSDLLVRVKLEKVGYFSAWEKGKYFPYVTATAEVAAVPTGELVGRRRYRYSGSTVHTDPPNVPARYFEREDPLQVESMDEIASDPVQAVAGFDLALQRLAEAMNQDFRNAEEGQSGTQSRRERRRARQR